jgi:hypothetical protein
VVLAVAGGVVCGYAPGKSEREDVGASIGSATTSRCRAAVPDSLGFFMLDLLTRPRGVAPPRALSSDDRRISQTSTATQAEPGELPCYKHSAVLREPYRAGTFEKSAPRPSAIVGCAIIASRKPV